MRKLRRLRHGGALVLAGALMAWGLFDIGPTLPAADAAMLRGGEWCTEHVSAATCEGCRPIGPNNSTKCLNAMGTEWHCRNTTNTVCQECRLGQQADCNGQGAFWNNGNCAGDPPLTLNNCTGMKYNPNATSGVADGTCPDDCPKGS
jgi:hypothetical protein